MSEPTGNFSAEQHKQKVDPRSAYKPITLQDLEAKEDPFFKDLDTPLAKWAAVLLFVLIFIMARDLYFLSPLLILILLGCVLYRMNTRERAIAGVPITFAAIRLGISLAEMFPMRTLGTAANMLRAQTSGVMWVPLFLGACLFYTPWKATYTSAVVFWESVVYLLAGLLPIDGFLGISSMMAYAMFFVIGFTLVRDFSPAWFASNCAPAAQPLEALPSHG
jgi:hypothetical protein